VPHDQRREQKDHERIEREKPGRWNFAPPKAEVDRPVGEILGPEQQCVALLIVGRPKQRDEGTRADEGEQSAPLAPLEWLVLAREWAAARRVVCRQRSPAAKVDGETDEHAYAGGAEAVVPPVLNGERAAYQWG
jgi:hypothetical protein